VVVFLFSTKVSGFRAHLRMLKIDFLIYKASLLVLNAKVIAVETAARELGRGHRVRNLVEGVSADDEHVVGYLYVEFSFGFFAQDYCFLLLPENVPVVFPITALLNVAADGSVAGISQSPDKNGSESKDYETNGNAILTCCCSLLCFALCFCFWCWDRLTGRAIEPELIAWYCTGVILSCSCLAIISLFFFCFLSKLSCIR